MSAPVVAQRREEAVDPLSALAFYVADRIVAAVAERLPDADSSPWLNRQEAIAYSALPKSTFDKLAADRRLPSHNSGRLFNRGELDEALGRL